MSIFERFFKSGSPRPAGVDISGVQVIQTKCPTCGMVGDFTYDPQSHDFFAIVELDKNTHLHPLECPYCTNGMLLCIRNHRLMGIEPFKDDPPTDMLRAVGRMRERLGM